MQINGSRETRDASATRRRSAAAAEKDRKMDRTASADGRVRPLTRLRKAPSRLLERVSRWTRRARPSSRSRNGSECSSNGGSGGVGRGSGDRGGADDDEGTVTDEPLLTEEDRKELLSLLKQNISMDFILEMKEAFQLFDKVRQYARGGSPIY